LNDEFWIRDFEFGAILGMITIIYFEKSIALDQQLLNEINNHCIKHPNTV
jgi:hypothetical protein